MPRTRKLSPLCTTSLLFGSPSLPVLRGVSGGGAALSPGFQLNLCSPEQIGAHFAAQSPERAFLAKPFFAQAKNGVNLRRRSLKISVGEAKCYICRHKRAAALHLITACGRSCLAAARVSSSSASGTAVLGLPRRPIHCRAPASQPSEGKPKLESCRADG